jgi:hypothetical protein
MIRLPAAAVGTLVICVLAAPGSAQDLVARRDALAMEAHLRIAAEECRSTTLPASFCQRIAKEAHDVDAWEFDDVVSHAQMESIEDICGSANAVEDRLQGLGEDFRNALAALRDESYPWGSGAESTATEAGRAVGRALHTIHDNCAHQGMANPEHAWFSLSDTCLDTALSPDAAPGVEDCARLQTQLFLPSIVAAVDDAGLASRLGQNSCVRDFRTDTNPCDQVTSPFPHEACVFLSEAKAWDGVHRVWDGAVVAPWLIRAFQGDPPIDFCADPDFQVSPELGIDVSMGTPSCTMIHVACLGKADEVDYSDIPSHSEGCSSTPRGGLDLLALVGLVLFRVRRR